MTDDLIVFFCACGFTRVKAARKILEKFTSDVFKQLQTLVVVIVLCVTETN